MEIEGLYNLTGIPARTRLDADIILFSLEREPHGYATTTELQAKANLKSAQTDDAAYMRDLNSAIWLLAESHGLKLRSLAVGGTPEALMYKQKFLVHHMLHCMEDASPALGLCDDTPKLAARYVKDVLGEALPVEMIPKDLRFAYRHLPVFDATSCSSSAASPVKP